MGFAGKMEMMTLALVRNYSAASHPPPAENAWTTRAFDSQLWKRHDTVNKASGQDMAPGGLFLC